MGGVEVRRGRRASRMAMHSALHPGHTTTTTQRRVLHSTCRITPPARTPWQDGQRMLSSFPVSTRLQSMPPGEAQPMPESSNEFTESECVPWRVRARVVVEVGQHIEAVITPRPYALRPVGEQAIVVWRRIEPPWPMKAEIHD